MVSAIGNDGPLYGTLNNPADASDVIGVRSWLITDAWGQLMAVLGPVNRCPVVRGHWVLASSTVGRLFLGCWAPPICAACAASVTPPHARDACQLSLADPGCCLSAHHRCSVGGGHRRLQPDLLLLFQVSGHGLPSGRGAISLASRRSRGAACPLLCTPPLCCARSSGSCWPPGPCSATRCCCCPLLPCAQGHDHVGAGAGQWAHQA